MSLSRRRVLVVIALSLVAIVPARAVVITNVTDEASLQAALTVAESNADDDVINLATGTYDAVQNGGGATFTYSSSEAFSLTLQGTGQLSTLITGNTAFQVLNLSAGHGGASLFVRDLTIAAGHLGAVSGGLFGAGAELGAGAGSVIVERVTFLANTANASGTGSIFGAGLDCNALTTCTLTDTTFTANTASSVGTGSVFGGAANFVAGGVVLQNVAVTGQVSTSAGSLFGGVFDVGSGSGSFTATLSNVTITGSQISTTGNGSLFGGVLNLGSGGDDAVETVDGMVISGSTVTDSGAGSIFGGVVSAGSGGTNEQILLRRLFVHDNTISESGTGTIFGGAVSMSPGGAGSLATLVNSAIGNNTVGEAGDGDAYGGGLSLGGDILLVHNTIWRNHLSEADAGGASGGGISDGSGSATKDLYNNVVFANTSTGTGQDIEFAGGSNTLNIFNNDFGDFLVTGGNTVNQGGNLNLDPLFSGTDFHLTALSPVIDQATASAPAEPSDDYDLDARPQGPLPDMGADEVVAAPIPVIEVPTLSEAGLALAAFLLALLGLGCLRRSG